MSGLSTCDWQGTTAVHEAAVIYISPVWREWGGSCPFAHSRSRKLSFLIQPGICCSLPTCSGTSNSNTCKRINAKKTNLRKSFLTNRFFKPFVSEGTVHNCVSALQSPIVWLGSNITNSVCSVQTSFVLERLQSHEKRCVLQCGRISQTEVQWRALQRATVEQLPLVS